MAVDKTYNVDEACILLKQDIEIKGKGGKGRGRSRRPREAPNTLQSTSTARAIDVISEGEIEGLADGLKSIYFDDTPLQNSDNSFNFEGVIAEFLPGTPRQEPPLGFARTENQVAVGADVIYRRPIIRSITNANLDAVRVTIRIPRLFKVNKDNGDTNPYRVSLRIEIQGSGSVYTTAIQDTISGKCVAPYERAYRINLPANQAPWNIRVTRLSRDDSDSSEQSKIAWQHYTELTDTKLEYADSAIVGMAVDAALFGNRIPRRTFDVYGIRVSIPNNYNPRTREYDGIWNGEFVTDWTDNPAWVLYDVITNERYGLGDDINVPAVDKFSLYVFAQYCDEMVDDGRGGREPRFTFNGVIRRREDAYAVINTVASVMRALPYWGTNQIVFTQDAPGNPVKSVTNSDVIDGIFEYSGTSLTDLKTVVYVAYTNPQDGYRPAITVVEDRDLIFKYGWRQIEISASYCTSVSQAIRYGRAYLDDVANIKDIVTYRASFNNANLRPGDIINVSDANYSGARTGGRLKSIDGNRIEFDSDITDDVLNNSATVLLEDTEGNYIERNIILRQNTLYMIGGTNNALYTLNIATSRATRIGSANNFGMPGITIRGLAYDSNNNILYGVSYVESFLFTLNTLTGVATRVGNSVSFDVGEAEARGLTYDTNNDILYMIGGSNAVLYTLDTSTGVATRVGNAPLGFGVSEFVPNALAYDTNNDVLYMVGNNTDALYTLNTSTGAATRVSNTNFFNIGETLPSGLAYNANDDVLYMLGSINDVLYSVDRITGRATRITNISGFGVAEFLPAALAFNPNKIIEYSGGTLDLQPGSNFIVSNNNLAPRPFRVMSVREDEKNIFEITARFYDPNRYNRIEEQLEIEIPDFAIQPTGAIPVPTELTAVDNIPESGNVSSPSVILSWSPSDDWRVAYYEVSIIPPNGDQYEFYSNVTNTSVDILPISPGEYSFRVIAFDRIGNRSDAVIFTHIALANAIDPQLPASVEANTSVIILPDGTSQSNIDLIIDNPDDRLVTAYELNLNADNTVLYAISNTQDALFTISQTTGRATRVNDNILDFGVQDTFPQGLAYNPNENVMYMVGDQTDILYTIDLETSVATPITNLSGFGVGENLPTGLTYNPNENVLYMIGDLNDALYTIDVETGRATRVGNATNFGVGEISARCIAYDSNNNRLYMCGINGNLYRLNTTTGEATRIGNANFFDVNEQIPAGLTYDTNTDTLYMLGDFRQALFTLNTVTGVATMLFIVAETNPTALAYNSDNSTLYMASINEDNLYTLNLVSRQQEEVGTITGFGLREEIPRSLAWDSNNEILYMVSMTTNALFRIDPRSGVATRRIGNATNFNINETFLTALTYDSNNDIYYSTGLTNPHLYVFNAETGQIERRIGNVEEFGVGERVAGGLAYDTNNNILYMVGSTNDALYTVDVETGIATRIGNVDSFGVSETNPTNIAYDANNNILYMIGNITNALYTLNVTTSEATRVGNAINFNIGIGSITGLAYDNNNNVLYATSESSNALFILNTTTGIATRVGSVSSFQSLPRTLTYNSNTNTLYLTSRNQDALFIVNPTTAEGTRVNPNAIRYGIEQMNVVGMAYNTRNNTLYAIGNNPEYLFTFDTVTGTGRRIGNVENFGLPYPIGGQAIAYDSTNDVLYLTTIEPNGNNPIFYTISMETGIAIPVSDSFDFGVGETLARGLTYDETTDTLYMIGDGTEALYTLNRTTGRATRVNNSLVNFGLNNPANPNFHIEHNFTGLTFRQINKQIPTTQNTNINRSNDENTLYTIPDVASEITYNISLRSLNSYGFKSDNAVNLNFFVDKDTTPPGRPTNITGVGGVSANIISWTPPPDNDFKKVLVYANANPNATDGSSSQFVGESTGSNFVHEDLIAGQVWAYWLVTEDFSGNRNPSPFPSANLFTTPDVFVTVGNDVSGTRSVRSQEGFIYYQPSSRNRPATPSTNNARFLFDTNNGFTGLPGNWGNLPPIAQPEGTYWSSRFTVREQTFNGVQTVRFSTPFNAINFNGVATFQNLNSELRTPGIGRITTIDGGLITTGQLNADRIRIDDTVLDTVNNQLTISNGGIGTDALMNNAVTDISFRQNDAFQTIGRNINVNLISLQITVGANLNGVVNPVIILGSITIRQDGNDDSRLVLNVHLRNNNSQNTRIIHSVTVQDFRDDFVKVIPIVFVNNPGIGVFTYSVLASYVSGEDEFSSNLVSLILLTLKK